MASIFLIDTKERRQIIGFPNIKTENEKNPISSFITRK